MEMKNEKEDENQGNCTVDGKRAEQKNRPHHRSKMIRLLRATATWQL
jgi:hypothetical protein